MFKLSRVVVILRCFVNYAIRFFCYMLNFLFPFLDSYYLGLHLNIVSAAIARP